MDRAEAIKLWIEAELCHDRGIFETLISNSFFSVLRYEDKPTEFLRMAVVALKELNHLDEFWEFVDDFPAQKMDISEDEFRKMKVLMRYVMQN